MGRAALPKGGPGGGAPPPPQKSRGDLGGIAPPEAILHAYRDGVTVICELAAQFTDATWLAVTPCSEWRAVDLAGSEGDGDHGFEHDEPA